MVPVRKPGRPLSSCPHPASRPCSCAAVTAAIPRKQTCHCGTSDSGSKPEQANSASSPVVKQESHSNGSTTPSSPTKGTTGTPFRVQKQTSKNGSSKRQSVDLTGLERMDANQLNIIQGASTMTPTPLSTMPEMASYGSFGMNMGGAAPFDASSGMYPMFQGQMPNPYMNPASTAKTNGSSHSDTNGAATPTQTQDGGCCGGKKATSDATNGQSSNAPSANGTQEKPTGGCCSSKSTQPSPPTANQQTKSPANGAGIQALHQPMPMANGMFPYFVQPNIFAYPPQYGSFMQPLQPEQWRQMMTAMSYSQPPQQNGMFGTGATNPMPFQNSSAPNSSTWTSHQCSCGEDCQCIGCAAHPYNEATQSYVRSAWNTMMQDSNTPHAHSRTPTNGHVVPDATNGQPNGIAATPAEGTVSPTAPQTPSDATSGLGEEQALSANDFFFVSYPFAEGCEGEMASCPCGDDCQCIGCAIHNNPVPDALPNL